MAEELSDGGVGAEESSAELLCFAEKRESRRDERKRREEKNGLGCVCVGWGLNPMARNKGKKKNKMNCSDLKTEF